MSRRFYGCPHGHDAGAYAPVCCLMGDGAEPEQGIIVADTHPFKAQNTWVDGTVGVPEAIKDSWDYGHDCLPHCLECNEEFERKVP